MTLYFLTKFCFYSLLTVIPFYFLTVIPLTVILRRGFHSGWQLHLTTEISMRYQKENCKVILKKIDLPLCVFLGPIIIVEM